MPDETPQTDATPDAAAFTERARTIAGHRTDLDILRDMIGRMESDRFNAPQHLHAAFVARDAIRRIAQRIDADAAAIGIGGAPETDA